MIRIVSASLLLILCGCTTPEPMPVKPQVKQHIELHVDTLCVKGLLTSVREKDVVTYYVGSTKVNLAPLLGFTGEDADIYFMDYEGWNVEVLGAKSDDTLHVFSLEVIE